MFACRVYHNNEMLRLHLINRFTMCISQYPIKLGLDYFYEKYDMAVQVKSDNLENKYRASNVILGCDSSLIIIS